MNPLPTCQVLDLGLIDYQQAWDLQNELAHEIAEGKHPPTLMLLEHPHTYTFGRSGHIENLNWDESQLKRQGVQVLWVDRGGDVTYHGPGQLVGYPLLPLGKITEAASLEPEGKGYLPGADYIGYLRKLEETLIRALQELGLQANRERGMTGVWVDVPAESETGRQAGGLSQPAKIAAIGVKVDASGVTRHGFALNVSPDMLYWQGIIACGLAGYEVASLAQLIHPVPEMRDVKNAVVSAFGQVFHFEMKKS